MLLVVAALAGCTPDRGEPDAAATTASSWADAATSMPTPAASAAAVPVLAGAYAPREECVQQPGWPAFAARLRAAIKARDAQAVAALADPAVKLDFGGGGGRAELIARLNGTKVAKPLWSELDALGALGCAFDKDGEMASLPWFFQQDITPLDPFEVLLAAGPNVLLLSRPDPAAKPVARLSWVLVKPIDASDWEAPYQQVTVIDHVEKGYVATRDLRSQIGYRLIASRGPQGWKIDAFIAGD